MAALHESRSQPLVRPDLFQTACDRIHLGRVEQHGRVADELRERGCAGAGDGNAAVERLEDGEPEALEERREYEAARARVEVRQLILVHVATEVDQMIDTASAGMVAYLSVTLVRLSGAHNP